MGQVQGQAGQTGNSGTTSAATAQTAKARAEQIAADCARIGRERAAENGDDLSSRTDAERTLRRELCASRIEAANLRGNVHALCAEVAALQYVGPAADRFTCASTFCGNPITLEYETDERAVRVTGFWLAGLYFDFMDSEVTTEQIARWTHDAECAETTRQECPERATVHHLRFDADAAYRGAVLGPAAVAERRAA